MSHYRLCVLFFVCSALSLAQPLGLHDALARPILAPQQPLVEVQGLHGRQRPGAAHV